MPARYSSRCKSCNSPNRLKIAAAPKQSCKRCDDLDLWADEAAEKLPRIIITGLGARS